jgi:transglutaminase-like putative cysteine protease
LYTQIMKQAEERFWDTPSVAILTLVLLTASQRLYATDWAPGLGTVLLVTFLGAMLGLALGFSRYKWKGVSLLSIGYSITLIPLVTSWIFYQDTPWLERMLSLGGRLGNALSLLFSSQPVLDTVLFVVFAELGFWLISLLAGYALTRRAGFSMVVVPGGILLLFIQLYDSTQGDRMIILALYAFLCLLLLGRMTIARKRLLWKVQRVLVSTESWTDLNIAIPVAALVLIILTWIIPTSIRQGEAAWDNISRPLDRVRQDLGNAIAGLRGSEQRAVVEFYGDSLALGQRASTGNAVFLSIRVPVLQTADRYYWRVRTYDRFQDNQWQSTATLTETFKPDQASLPMVDNLGLSNEFIFRSPRANLAVLVTPAHPIWVSRPAVLSYTTVSENEIDPLMFQTIAPIQAGEQYIVHANIYNPTVFQLRQAGALYPAWVKDRYLQLPEDLSPLITELALRITGDAETPYDQTIAITDYLRTTITYADTIETPPVGTDLLAWFLFNSQAGFCKYYATAEVILLRSAGIPARLVVGFAQGEYESPDRYTVLEKDAHAWPEVYFSGIGWVEFEPTSSQPVLARLAGEPTPVGQSMEGTPDQNGQENPGRSSNPVEDTGTGGGPGMQPNSLQRISLFFGLSLFLIFGIALAYIFGLFDKLLICARRAPHKPFPILITGVYASLAILPPDWLRRWAFYAGSSPIERSFHVVFQSLRWLAVKPTPAQTPGEVAAALTERLPERAEEIKILLLEYEKAHFSQDLGDLQIARLASEQIRRDALRAAFSLRRSAFRAAFLRIISRKPQNK